MTASDNKTTTVGNKDDTDPAGSLNDQKVISTVSQSISLNPVFAVAKPGDELDFTAKTPDNRPLTWSMKPPALNDQLNPTTGNKTTYKASSGSSTDMFIMNVIKVTDDQDNRAQAEVLIISRTLGGEVEADLAQAGQGKAQLRFLKYYPVGPIPIPNDRVSWRLLAGTGSVDGLGVYTQPQENLPGLAVITGAFERTPEFEGAPVIVDYGYIVLPLPLSQSPDTAKTYP